MLGELSDSDHVALTVMHEDKFPVARDRVEYHLVTYAADIGQLSKVNLDLDVLFLIVSHELEFNHDIIWPFLRQSRFEGLTLLLLRGKQQLFGYKVNFDLLKEGEGLAGLINSAELELRTVFDEIDLEALLHLPDGDLVCELLHEHPHHIITLSVDDQGGKVVKRGRLQVDDDKAPTVRRASCRHVVGRRYTQA